MRKRFHIPSFGKGGLGWISLLVKENPSRPPFEKGRLNTESIGKIIKGHLAMDVLFFIILLLLVYLLNTAVRYRQHIDVSQSISHEAAGHIIMAANDPYRWLRYAKEMSAGTFVSGKDPLSAGTPLPFTPPLSFMICKLAGASGLDMETASSLLTVFLSGLFVFPLGILMYRLGMPAAGIGGGITGGLCLAYLQRTTAFQPDTDMLNLFFPLTIILFIHLAGRGRTLLWSAAAGLFCWFHYRWYVHSGFAPVWLTLLMVYLLIMGKKGNIILYSVLVFIIFCSPLQFYSGFTGLFDFFSEGAKSYPAAVDELRRMTFAESLRMLTKDGWSALAGLLLFGATLRRTYLLLPLFALGCLMFFKGERFGMYLGMFAGMGFGVLSAFVFGRVRRFGFALSCAGTLFISVMLIHPYFVPAPYVSKQLFEEMEKLNIPAGSAVVSHWNYGFLLQYLKNVGTVSDGASQFKEGWLLTRELMRSADPNPFAGRVDDEKPLWLVLTEDMNVSGGLHGYFNANGLYFTNIEHGLDSDLKITENGMFFSIYNNKTHESFFGKSFIIGTSDIGCFKLENRKYPYIAVYKAKAHCQ